MSKKPRPHSGRVTDELGADSGGVTADLRATVTARARTGCDG